MVRKKYAAFCIILCLMVYCSLGAFAAAKDPVTLTITDNAYTVALNGRTLQAGTVTNTDVRLQNNGTKLSLQLNTTTGTTNVDLEDSQTFVVDADLRSLTVGSSVVPAAAITINKDRNVNSLLNYSPAKVTIAGSVGDLTARGASPITLDQTGYVGTARMNHLKSSLRGNGSVGLALVQNRGQVSAKNVQDIQTLNASNAVSTASNIDTGYYSYYRYYSTPNAGNNRAGLYVDHTEPVRTDWTRLNTNNNMRSGGMYFEIAPLDVVRGTLLRQLYAQLTNNVRVTANASGLPMNGRVAWLDEETTRVNASGYYRFLFIPDDTAYAATPASIYLSVDNGRTYYDYNIDLVLDKGYIEYYPDNIFSYAQLWELQRYLEDAVFAYIPNTQRAVSGTYEWIRPNQYVYSSGYYGFRFTPDNTRYPPQVGSIYIDVMG